jgi:hypothetical protein
LNVQGPWTKEDAGDLHWYCYVRKIQGEKGISLFSLLQHLMICHHHLIINITVVICHQMGCAGYLSVVCLAIGISCILH